jgi:hypothetical protein
MVSRLEIAVSKFGKDASAKLSNPAVIGAPEDQLRAPFEGLIRNLAVICGFVESDLGTVGESSLSSLKTRPDYAITVRNALIGFAEIKAPGKGGDPRRFKGKHDKDQWNKLKSLPNLLAALGRLAPLG